VAVRPTLGLDTLIRQRQGELFLALVGAAVKCSTVCLFRAPPVPTKSWFPMCSCAAWLPLPLPAILFEWNVIFLVPRSGLIWPSMPPAFPRYPSRFTRLFFLAMRGGLLLDTRVWPLFSPFRFPRAGVILLVKNLPKGNICRRPLIFKEAGGTRSSFLF